MSRITAEAETILRRVVQMAQLVHNVERQLLEDQADDVYRAGGGGGVASGHGDPTPGLVATLAPHAARERKLWASLRAINGALDDAERICVGALNGEHFDDTPRCPGWTTELRARLGGCGKPIEHWTDANGHQHNRATLLCVGCRKAQERSDRELVSHDQ